jgi:hypothetical protein
MAAAPVNNKHCAALDQTREERKGNAQGGPSRGAEQQSSRARPEQPSHEGQRNGGSVMRRDVHGHRQGVSGMLANHISALGDVWGLVDA